MADLVEGARLLHKGLRLPPWEWPAFEDPDELPQHGHALGWLTQLINVRGPFIQRFQHFVAIFVMVVNRTGASVGRVIKK